MNWMGPFSLVIPTGVRSNSAEVFSVLDPDSGGASTFSVALSETGELPATFWACRTVLEVDTYNALINMDTIQFKAYVDLLSINRDRNFVSGVNFKNSLQIGSSDFWTFIASLGLQRIAV